MKYSKPLILAVALLVVGVAGYAAVKTNSNQVKADSTTFNESFMATLRADQEVGSGTPMASSTVSTSSPQAATSTIATSTLGMGQGIFNVSSDGQTLYYHVEVNNLSSAFTAAHLHCGAMGQAGPVVIPLMASSTGSSTVMLHGTASSTVLTGAAANCQPNIQTMAHLFQAMREGKIYVNVHTTNFPNGETRGQLLKSNMIIDFPGMATSTATTTIPTNPGTGTSTGTSTPTTTPPTTSTGWHYVFVQPDAYYKIQGSSVRFMGSHFVPGETVTIATAGQSNMTISADSSGNFTTNWIQIPYGIGMRTYTFTGSSSGIAFPVGINVGNGSPWIVLSTYYAGMGSSVTISGNQFGANENVTVWFGGTNVGTVMTNNEGSFSLTTTVPNLGAGQKTVTATGASTGMSTSQSFSQSQ
jgi:hypothetical protein